MEKDFCSECLMYCKKSSFSSENCKHIFCTFCISKIINKGVDNVSLCGLCTICNVKISNSIEEEGIEEIYSHALKKDKNTFSTIYEGIRPSFIDKNNTKDILNTIKEFKNEFDTNFDLFTSVVENIDINNITDTFTDILGNYIKKEIVGSSNSSSSSLFESLDDAIYTLGSSLNNNGKISHKNNKEKSHTNISHRESYHEKNTNVFSHNFPDTNYQSKEVKKYSSNTNLIPQNFPDTNYQSNKYTLPSKEVKKYSSNIENNFFKKLLDEWIQYFIDYITSIFTGKMISSEYSNNIFVNGNFKSPSYTDNLKCDIYCTSFDKSFMKENTSATKNMMQLKNIEHSEELKTIEDAKSKFGYELSYNNSVKILKEYKDFTDYFLIIVDIVNILYNNYIEKIPSNKRLNFDLIKENIKSSRSHYLLENFILKTNISWEDIKINKNDYIINKFYEIFICFISCQNICEILKFTLKFLFNNENNLICKEQIFVNLNKMIIICRKYVGNRRKVCDYLSNIIL